jgi:hypothetical protein
VRLASALALVPSISVRILLLPELVTFITPLVPDDPEVPEEPEVPLEPELPDVPEVPEVPSDPDDPELPLDPEDPDVPDEPEVPLEPDEPEVPSDPLVPEVPLEPEVPLDPDDAAASLVPILPLASTTKTVSSAIAGRLLSCKVEPVIAPSTLREFNAAAEPLVMTFFQFGIFFNITVGYEYVLAHFPSGPIIFLYYTKYIYK